MIARVYLRISDKEGEKERERERGVEDMGRKVISQFLTRELYVFYSPEKNQSATRRLCFCLECLSGGKKLGVQINLAS